MVVAFRAGGHTSGPFRVIGYPFLDGLQLLVLGDISVTQARASE